MQNMDMPHIRQKHTVQCTHLVFAAARPVIHITIENGALRDVLETHLILLQQRLNPDL